MLNPKLRYDRHRVPILSKEGIDELGEAFVRDFNPEAMKEPSPLDVDRFVCDYLGLIQDFAYLSNDGRYLGMTVFNDTGRVIIYDPERDEADYMAVNAGTVIIDNTLLETGKERRYRFTMHRKSVAQWTPGDRMEWQANRLSSALLMPRSMVYKLVRSLPQEKSIDFDIMAILAVADVFDVSNEAAQYRLLDFGLIRSRAPIQTLLDFSDAM